MPSTPAPSARSYRFAVDGFDPEQLRVHAFTGREALSEHYAFEIILTADSAVGEDVERLVLGRRAVFTWTAGRSPRAFYGLVAAARLEEVHDNDRSVQVHVRFVPRLWLLKRRRRSRVFQNLTVPDVVAAVLKEAGIAVRWQLVRQHPAREYVTQYEESDYRFITRLLAEAGIYYFFAEGPELDPSAAADALVPGDTVVFGDDATGYPPIGGDDPSILASGSASAGDAPALSFLPAKNTTVGHSDKITRFTSRDTVRATRASFRDYDPDRPQTRPSSDATSNAPFADPATDPTAPATGPDLEVYEHHGRFLFPKWTSTTEEASLILRQKRRRASTAAGDSGCSDLAPGHRFALQDHPATHLDRAYVVTSVDHRGQAHPQAGGEWKVYENSFACAPAEVVYVPPRPKRRSTQVALTATVVGPPGEDIYVDPTGQIKVQFHWDRSGSFDDRSSCWIRTMHPWGGAGWGVQLIPRVGMEVVVVFEGGDPDKPMVLGAMYNGTHPPPFALPGDRTRSGIRTQTSPGGGGSNELSFEDQAGSEQVYLHAQRDLDEVVERNHTLLARGDERLRVVGSRMDIVEEDAIARVGRHAEEHVGGDRTAQVEGNRIDVVTGNSDERVSGMLVTRIEGKERRSVQKSADLEYADDLTTRVRGCLTTLVGKDDAKRSWVTHAEGTAKLTSSVSTEIGSEKELVLRVGKSAIRITSEKIEILSPAVTVKGEGGGLSADDDGLKLGSKKDAQLLVEKKIVLKSKEGGSLSMEKEVKVDGQQILLNSPEQAKDPPPKEPEPPTKITFKDQDGKPLAYQRYLVTMADGSEVSGMTDKDGKAEEDLKSGGKVRFPDLTKAKAG